MHVNILWTARPIKRHEQYYLPWTCYCDKRQRKKKTFPENQQVPDLSKELGFGGVNGAL